MPLWGSNFYDIGRCCAGHDEDAKAENESTGNVLANLYGGGDGCSPDANGQATHEHACTATKAVSRRGQG